MRFTADVTGCDGPHREPAQKRLAEIETSLLKVLVVPHAHADDPRCTQRVVIRQIDQATRAAVCIEVGAVVHGKGADFPDLHVEQNGALVELQISSLVTQTALNIHQCEGAGAVQGPTRAAESLQIKEVAGGNLKLTAY